MKGLRLAALCLLLVCVTFMNACSRNVDLNSAAKKKIALIVRMNSGYHWSTVKMGADTAAREFNVSIDYNAPGDEEDVEEQIKLVDQALENKVDALILAASDYKALVKVTEKAYERRLPVIIIDSEVDTKKVNSFIATDNYDAGKKAGAKLVEVAGTENRIAVMSFVKGTRSAELREEGLLNVISQYPEMKVVAKEYCLSDTKLAYSLTKKMLLENDKIGAIVALNSIASEGVAQAVSEMGLADQVKIVAFDSTPKEIEYLEKGVIQATVTQDPFSMGYLGVKFAVDGINGKTIPEFTATKSKVIDINNMYLPENQKLLFPIVK